MAIFIVSKTSSGPFGFGGNWLVNPRRLSNPVHGRFVASNL
jgi:hypothetical protein